MKTSVLYKDSKLVAVVEAVAQRQIKENKEKKSEVELLLLLFEFDSWLCVCVGTLSNFVMIFIAKMRRAKLKYDKIVKETQKKKTSKEETKQWVKR